MEVAETKKAILKQKVKVIKKRLEMQKTEHIDSTWSSIKTRLFSRTPDNNLKKYIGISLAPRAPDKQVCEEEIIRRKMEVDNNFALSDEEKVIEKTVHNLLFKKNASNVIYVFCFAEDLP